MTDYYSGYDRMAVGVDCVIFGLNRSRLSILLARRRFEPEKGRWSLMGGFVRADESVDNAAKRVLSELTGLTDVYMQQVGTFGAVDRDPGARVVSVAYCALINFDEHDRQRVTDHGALWIDIDEMPVLGFDHNLMVKTALSFLRQRMSWEPLAFSLLPRYFTLTQLQQLYETVMGEEIDKRNFRKRALDNACVEKTELIDKVSSRRGAALYTFNPEKLEGHDFHI